jgi:5'-AMP-activated protein kinase catalytic alpha subunit
MHYNIIQIYAVIETLQDIYIVMEYVSGGELFELIVLKQRLTEPEACKYFQQIIGAVEYLHKVGVAHRDIKPENLLLDYNKDIKIVDFGLSNLYNKGELLKTPCGSPSYAAPEMLSCNCYNGMKADIWSIGIVLFAMVCGFLPFDEKNDDRLFKMIKEGKYNLPTFLSHNVKDLIKRILITDPKRRLSFEAIKNHPWFKITKSIVYHGLFIKCTNIPVWN